MSTLAAGYMISAIKENPRTIVGLPTGSTPIGMYKVLTEAYDKKIISFSEVITFNLDEYIGLDKSDENSYYNFMFKNFFSKVDIDPMNINIPDGMTKDVLKECIDYENKIKLTGTMDIIFLGIGKNGHIGFNEPEEYFEPYTHKVDLDKSTLYANSKFFRSIDEVPTNAITIGIKTILSAKKIILLASGEEKAQILKQAIKGKITPRVPSSILQLHEDIIIITDQNL